MLEQRRPRQSLARKHLADEPLATRSGMPYCSTRQPEQATVRPPWGRARTAARQGRCVASPSVCNSLRDYAPAVVRDHAIRVGQFPGPERVDGELLVHQREGRLATRVTASTGAFCILSGFLSAPPYPLTAAQSGLMVSSERLVDRMYKRL
jgi:hypothetical protein